MKKENKNIYNGNLVITKENQDHYTHITEVSGSIYVSENATFTAPALTKSGYIDVRANATFTAPALTEVSGYIDVRANATFTAPALTEVSGSIYVRANATFTAPVLTKSGSIYVSENATFTAPALTEVSGYIDVRANATFTAPALTKSGSIDVRANATFTAPALTEVSGYIYVSENATFTAPALTKSGYIDVRANATIDITQTKEVNYKSIDNTLFVVESEKTSKGIKIYTGYVMESITDGMPDKKNCFVAEKDSFYAHGETVKNAISDLQFKIVAEKLKKEPIEADTMISINHYRLVTGACELGVKSWMEQNNIKDESIRADKLLPLLRNTHAYGLSRFESLINF